MKGNLYIISSVAGGGKSTLISRILNKHPEILFSVSCTSRPIRPGEKDGVNYHFKSRSEFEELISKDYFYEWALVHDNYYGTPKDFILSNLKQNRKIILDIDVQGAEKVKEQLPESVSIFILPPSIEIWQERLRNRGTETAEVIEKRIRNGFKELKEQDKFDFRVINDSLENAGETLEKILLGNS
ncbi:MAG TPA: guanylate kinase [Leptospiraceae bacterium]|nr:guanylate kinase [Leptospiraceae bacterium]HMY68934.1 guanylate kinase [Leptospiraceae bacterium]HNF12482.1 guanylate kinase [Leptospiraceae bacterium]HNF23417.1 guanylate kinase [Leptospiraceae bacterium]HNI95458.1 guanylate kinase [Leptospiraceae bacterium]